MNFKTCHTAKVEVYKKAGDAYFEELNQKFKVLACGLILGIF